MPTRVAVEISPDGKRIWLRSPYSPEIPAQCKRVPGASFSKEHGAHWSYPLEWPVCLKLREVFGRQLSIGPNLYAWASAERSRAARLGAIRKATDAELSWLPEVSPTLAHAVSTRTYQRVAARFAADAGSCLIADQPGLGKTLETLAAIVERRNPGIYLVFAPKTAVLSVWTPEVRRWLPECGTVHPLSGTIARRREDLAAICAEAEREPGYHFIIANIEMVRVKKDSSCPREFCSGDNEFCEQKAKHKTTYTPTVPELFGREWDGIVVDESHRALIRTSGKHTQQRLGFERLRLAEGGVKIALSGTPMRGKPQKLWGTLNWLRPDLYRSYWRWVEEYFHITKDNYGATIGALRDDRRAALDESLSSIMIRRTKEEVLPDLPRKSYGGEPLDPDKPDSPIAVWLPMEGKQARAYSAMVNEAAADLEGGELLATGVLAEMTRLKQFASASGILRPDGTFAPSLPSNKVEWILQALEERGIAKASESEGDSKIVIASQFTQMIDMLSGVLDREGIAHYTLTGRTPDARRAEYVAAFQRSGGPRVFLLNTMAGGVAVTLDAADELVFLDETWVPDDQEQVEDRIHRTSRIHQVVIWYLHSLGTIEEEIARRNLSMDGVQKELMDGSRGVSFARQLLGRK